MPIVKVEAPEQARAYDIHIGHGLLKKAAGLLERCQGHRAMIVTDENVAPLYLDAMKAQLEAAGAQASAFVLPAGETTKCMAQLERIYDALIDAHITRQDFVVALGGGVVGDMTGFAAATWLRGTAFVQIPTTLLAQVDSSVGGKTGVDIPEGKNLVGAFWQPIRVIADPDTLRSLPPEIFADGMAEVIKAACIKDAGLFEQLADGSAVLPENLEDTITRCINIKRLVVEHDETESGERKLLNFGHTMGHALEKFYDYSALTHGRAVALGMVIVSEASERQGLTEKGVTRRIADVLERYHLPIADTATLDDYLPGVANDKKRSGSSIDLVLLHDIGDSFLYRLPLSLLGGFLRGEEI